MARAWLLVKFILNNHGPRVWFHAMAVCLGLIYLETCPRDIISIADSCEIVTASHLMIPSHPPGFPLYIVLGKLLSSFFFFVNLVYVRYVLLTIMLALATLYVLMHLTLSLTDSRSAALMAAACLGLTREFWLYAVIPEVFSLNTLLSVFVLTQVVRWHQRGSHRDLIGSAFTAGLGWNNHWTIILLGPAIALSLLYRRPSRACVIASAAAFFSGLSFVFVTMLLMQNDGPLLFPQNLSWNGFVELSLRTRYGMMAAGGLNGTSLNFDSVRFFSQSLLRQYSPLFIVLAGLGVWHLLRRNRGFIFLPLAFLFTGPLFIYYMNIKEDSVTATGMMERFHILPMMIMAPILAAGIRFITERILPHGLKRYWAPLVLAVVMGGLGFRNWTSVDRHDDRITRSFAAMALDGLPFGSLLFTYNDAETFAISYILHVEGNPRKILHLNSRGFASMPRDGLPFKKYLDHNRMPQQIRFTGPDITRFLRANVSHLEIFALYHSLRPEYGIGDNGLLATPGRGLAFRLCDRANVQPPDMTSRIFFPLKQQLYLSGESFNDQMNVIYMGTLQRIVTTYRKYGRPEWAERVQARAEKVIPEFSVP